LWKAAADGGFGIPYAELVRRTRQGLRKAGYEQVPQLEGPAALLAQPMLAPFAFATAA
jgi:hypothetical protein